MQCPFRHLAKRLGATFPGLAGRQRREGIRSLKQKILFLPCLRGRWRREATTEGGMHRLPTLRSLTYAPGLRRSHWIMAQQ